jgi:hypothetical protein
MFQSAAIFRLKYIHREEMCVCRFYACGLRLCKIISNFLLFLYLIEVRAQGLHYPVE